MTDELVPVRVRDCPDGSHPEGDFAYLKPRPDPDIGFAASGVFGRSLTDPALLTIELGRVYLRFGIVQWDLHDGATPWPLGLDSIARLDWATETFPLADKAAELYSSVLDPLVGRLLKPLRTGSTGDSTSAKKRSSSKRPKRSKQSTTGSSRPRQKTSKSTDGESSTSPSLALVG